MKILIVEDAGFVREILEQNCVELGHHIIGEATNGLMAINLAEKLHPELIIMDLVLPEKNGLEAALEITKVNPAIEILAITSLDQEWVERKNTGFQCKYFLKKPFSKNELENILNIIQTERRNLKHG
jgi:YesN/AraC family two-component response regulator